MTPKAPTPAMPDIVITSGKDSAWATTDKYLAVRDAFLKILPKKKPGLLYDDAWRKAKPLIPPALFASPSALNDYAKEVAADMDRRGMIEKIDGTKQWRRTG